MLTAIRYFTPTLLQFLLYLFFVLILLSIDSWKIIAQSLAGNDVDLVVLTEVFIIDSIDLAESIPAFASITLALVWGGIGIIVLSIFWWIVSVENQYKNMHTLFESFTLRGRIDKRHIWTGFIGRNVGMIALLGLTLYSLALLFSSTFPFAAEFTRASLLAITDPLLWLFSIIGALLCTINIHLIIKLFKLAMIVRQP